MIIILGALILLVIGILLVAYGASDNWGGVGVCIIIACFVALFFIIIEFPLSHYNTDLENATILKEIMLVNRRLAKKKYANTTIYDIWIPDAIMEVEPVK